MRFFRLSALALIAGLTLGALTGCNTGQPARYDTAAAHASRQAVIPAQTFGFHPAARQAIGIPVETAKCLSGFITRGIADAFQTADCVLDSLIPIVTPPEAPQAAQYVDVHRTIMVPETYTETKTRMVPKTVIERQSVPCAPPAPQYVPAPQRAPGCEPVSCADGNCGR